MTKSLNLRVTLVGSLNFFVAVDLGCVPGTKFTILNVGLVVLKNFKGSTKITRCFTEKMTFEQSY